MSTLQRVSDLSQDTFREEHSKIWQAAGKVIDTIISQVEEGVVTPIEGMGAIASVLGQFYGYEAFHSRPSVSDLYFLSESLSQP